MVVDASFDLDIAEQWERASQSPRSAVGKPHTPPSDSRVLRPQAVRVVARQVRAGTYRPRADDVAELVMAWLFLGTRARAN